jgi:hypothetical protein
LQRTLSETGEKGKDESGQYVNSAARTEPSYSAEARSDEGMRASQKAEQERDIRQAALPINGAPAAAILSGDNLHEKWSVWATLHYLRELASARDQVEAKENQAEEEREAEERKAERRQGVEEREGRAAQGRGARKRGET